MSSFNYNIWNYLELSNWIWFDDPMTRASRGKSFMFTTFSLGFGLCVPLCHMLNWSWNWSRNSVQCRLMCSKCNTCHLFISLWIPSILLLSACHFYEKLSNMYIEDRKLVQTIENCEILKSVFAIRKQRNNWFHMIRVQLQLHRVYNSLCFHMRIQVMWLELDFCIHRAFYLQTTLRQFTFHFYSVAYRVHRWGWRQRIYGVWRTVYVCLRRAHYSFQTAMHTPSLIKEEVRKREREGEKFQR